MSTQTRYLVDTCIFIELLRGKKEAKDWFLKHQNQIVVSVITVAELYSGSTTESKLEVLDHLLQTFQIIELSGSMAKRIGRYRLKYGKSQGVGLADAAIAVCSEEAQAVLITHNLKHFPMLERIEKPY